MKREKTQIIEKERKVEKNEIKANEKTNEREQRE